MDSENDSSGVYLDAAASSTLGEAQQPKLGKVIEDTSETIESLKPLGLTADDVKVLYKAYKKEKKEKESLQDNSEKSGNKVSALIEDDDEEMTLAKEWNLNNLRGMGWFEALVDTIKKPVSYPPSGGKLKRFQSWENSSLTSTDGNSLKTRKMKRL